MISSVQSRSKTSVFFVFYLFIFSLLKVVWIDFAGSNTTLILGLSAAFLLTLSFIYSRPFLNKPFILALFFLVLNGLFFTLNFVFRSNGDLFYLRFYEFTIFGVVPLLLFSQVRHLETVFKVYINLSILLFFLYAIDPFLEYKYSGNYMDYGYQMMVPVFFGTHLGRILFSRKYLIFLQIISFALILIFGNRMASVACVVFVLMIDLLYLDFNSKKKMQYTILAFLLLLASFFFHAIVLIIADVLEKNNLSSYSLRTILNFNDLNTFSAGRNSLWEGAIEMIVKKPILGHGIGAFEATYGTYPHNIILELLISFGFIGFLFYFFFLLNSIKQLLSSSGYIKLIGILLFCSSFPKLFTSIYFYKEPSFWLFLFYGFFAPFLKRPFKYHDVN